MNADNVSLHIIYKETMNRLASLSRRVSEARDVAEASDFARWLYFSGIINLLEANPYPEPLKVDGAFMRWTVDQLVEQCNERFRTNNSDPTFKAAEFQSLHEKIDTMAGYLSRLASAAQFQRLTTPDSLAESSEPINETVIHLDRAANGPS